MLCYLFGVIEPVFSQNVFYVLLFLAVFVLPLFDRNPFDKE